jgi:peptide/nickel transport system substrate-binding protein
MKKSVFILWVILLASIIVLASCGGSTTTVSSTTTVTSTTSAPPVTQTTTATTTQVSTTTTTAAAGKYGGVYRVITNQQPSGYLGYEPEMDFRALMEIGPAIESLFRMDSKANLMPFLATSYDLAPDKLSLLIHLRQGIKFHDGSDFNAEAAAWNIQRIISIGYASASTWDSAEVVDDYTIKMNLKKFTNGLENSLTRTLMVSKAAFDAHGKDWSEANPVGTGPFKFAEFKRDEYLKYTRNDNYWQVGLPYLDGVEYLFIMDPVTQTAAFLNGEAENFQPQRQDIAGLIAKGYVRVPNPAYGGSQCVLEFDSKTPDSPFGKLEVRQAISLAINRDAIVAARGFGFWHPLNQWASPGQMGYLDDLPPAEYNPNKAKQLLADAGYPKGFKIDFIPQPFLTDMDMMTAVHDDLNAVGITGDIKVMSQGEYSQQRYTTGWTNGLATMFVANGPNLGVVMESFCSATCITSHMLYVSDEFTQALNAALAAPTMDPTLLQNANRIVTEGLFQIPVYWFEQGMNVLQPYVHDTGTNEQNIFLLWTPELTWMDKH